MSAVSFSALLVQPELLIFLKRNDYLTLFGLSVELSDVASRLHHIDHFLRTRIPYGKPTLQQRGGHCFEFKRNTDRIEEQRIFLFLTAAGSSCFLLGTLRGF